MPCPADFVAIDKVILPLASLVPSLSTKLSTDSVDKTEKYFVNRYLEPLPVDEYIPCWRPSEAGTALIVVAWLATRPPHALSALLMRCQQKTLPTGIGS